MKDIRKTLALGGVIFVIAVTSATFEAYANSAELPPEPVINNIYCAPALVVVCKRGGNDLSCQEFGSREEANEYLAAE